MDYVFSGIIIGTFVVIFALVLGIEHRAPVNVSDFNVSCLEGVEYWYRQNGNRAYLAPRIDSETLAFVRCND